MSNSININGVEVSAYDYLGEVMIGFRKGGKIMRTIRPEEIGTCVRPENRDAVKALAAAVKVREITREDMIRAETAEDRICREAQERRDARTDAEKAAHKSGIDAIEAHQRRMARIMAVQG